MATERMHLPPLAIGTFVAVAGLALSILVPVLIIVPVVAAIAISGNVHQPNMPILIIGVLAQWILVGYGAAIIYRRRIKRVKEQHDA